MKHSDFKVGESFWTTNDWRWLCTDKGARVIVAIHIDEEHDSSWLKGPPYALAEIVFDENDMLGCHEDQENNSRSD